MLADVLHDIVVLDFGQLIAGPTCGMWLADMGATVIKVEPPNGELGRQLGPPWMGGESLTSLAANRNKLGLCVDLKHGSATELMRRVVPQCDVLIENFRPGVMRRLGLDYATLQPVSPRLIYCSISAYGSGTPWRDRPGVDGIIQAATGFMSGIGAPGSEPGKAPLPLADMTGALFALVAVLGALRRRDQDNAGAHLDVSLYSGMLMLQQMNLAALLSSGFQPEKLGSAAPYAAPNEALPTSDGWIMIAAYQPKRWQALCLAIACPELMSDARFASNEARVANRTALRATLSKVLRQNTTEHWCSLFEAADILVAPVASYDEVVATEQYASSGIEVEVEHPVAGRIRMPGFAVGAPAAPPRHPPPQIGEHSRLLLTRFGLSATEVDRLAEQGVIRENAA